ncbi:phage baseplate assembly protein V [Cereibacter changlensis]|nr:phage baseplate assembly protein V [Cereibacter changlensis]
MSLAAAEADRRIGAMLNVGTIVSIDNATGRARVRIGDLLTPPLQVMQIRSGAIRLHWMPSPGEQVTVSAPSGDMARAFVMGSLPIDGNLIAPDASSPTMDLGGGTLRLIGNLYVEGDIEVTGDVRASGVSLVTHTHGGVIPGGGDTGGPNG